MFSTGKKLLIFLVCGLFSSAVSKDEKPLSEFINRFTLIAGDTLLESSKGENVVFAPLNIFHSFRLLHLGAVNETKTELAQIFGFPDDAENDTTSHEKFSNFLLSLQDSKNVTILPAAGIFVQNGVELKKTYVERARAIHGAKIKNINFANSGETTEYINKWISRKTKKHIPKFFDEPLDPRTKVQLVSALYFAADWKVDFASGATAKEIFNSGRSTFQVDMMKQIGQIEYLDDPKYSFRVVGLPYKNEDFCFYIQLPREEPTSANFTINFNTVYLTSVEAVTALKPTLVYVKFPRLNISSKKDLKIVLEKFGSRHILESPLLNGIFDELVTDVEVNHGAAINIDETGTVGAAVSSVSSSTRSRGPLPVHFFVNKPFTFFLYYKPAETILFTGAVSHF